MNSVNRSTTFRSGSVNRHMLFATLIAVMFVFAWAMPIEAFAQSKRGHLASGSGLSVAVFLERGEKLMAKGILATLDPDYGILEKEVETAVESWIKRAPTATPAVCMPKNRELALDASGIIAIMRAVPPGDRQAISARDAVGDHLNRVYRCKP